MKNKQIQSIIVLLLTIIALASTVFAWYTVSNMNQVDPFIVNTTSYKMDLTLKINDEIANAKDEVEAILFNAKPSDEFVFELTVNFSGSVNNYETNIMLFQIEQSPLLEAFYIKDMKVYIYQNEVLEKENILSNMYLNELINSNNNVSLGSVSFNPNETKIISFTLVFDELSQIQAEILKINGIRIIGA